jgi:hypothetical protein
MERAFANRRSTSTVAFGLRKLFKLAKVTGTDDFTPAGLPRPLITGAASQLIARFTRDMFVSMDQVSHTLSSILAVFEAIS